MGFTFTYDLEGAGWAMARIQDRVRRIDITVSYLHDSLREIGEAARAVAEGATQAKVVFMDEPGEIHLLLERVGENLKYEARWFDDWNSWDMYPGDKFKVVFSGCIAQGS